MSDSNTLLAPTPHPPSSSLAPPRPSSSQSNRSNSSRGRKSPSSSNISRSNSRSSGRSDPDRKQQSGKTTTISGGTSLGPSTSPINGEGKGKQNGQAPKVAANAGNKESGEKNKGNRKASSNKSRPNPINTAPSRPNSQNTNTKSSSTGEDTQSAPVQRSIHTTPSVPKTAIQAASEAAKQKKGESADGALANLQKMISDLKAIPPTASSSGSSGPGSRSASGAKEPSSAGSKVETSSVSAPVPIPTSSTSTSSKKLKADAPSFTPSFQAISPVASQAPISPVGITSPPWAHQQPRSASHGSAGNRRPSIPSQLHPYQSVPNLAPPQLPLYGNSVPSYFSNSLHVHQEADNEDLSPLSYPSHIDESIQQQQLLAAQALQYQQIQLLQAQLAAAHQQAQQQHQQPHQSGSFIAPRFQALAAQRVAQQQQQQAQQLAQAQQLYEMQQQQILEYARQQEDAQTARALAEATLQNPPPVFEEDSPEPKHASLGPTGRPQLAPTFTFGGKKNAAESVPERASLSPPTQPPVINRSEGIGGAQATGLAGLAARAHKRTGSELTPAMQEQVCFSPRLCWSADSLA